MPRSDGLPDASNLIVDDSSRQANDVQLDWQAYFKEFCVLHGGDPVLYRGRLLFQDGWQYSSTDFRGPEWAPTKNQDELKQMQRSYWITRKAIVAPQIDDLKRAIESLEMAQRERSARLQQTSIYFDQESGKYAKATGPVSLDAMRSRLSWLEADLVMCEGHIREFTPVWI